MSSIVLIFEGPPEHRLSELSDVDAGTLVSELEAQEGTFDGRALARRMKNARESTATVETISVDSSELEAVHQVCVQSSLPASFEGLCEEVARARVRA